MTVWQVVFCSPSVVSVRKVDEGDMLFFQHQDVKEQGFFIANEGRLCIQRAFNEMCRKEKGGGRMTDRLDIEIWPVNSELVESLIFIHYVKILARFWKGM